MTEAKIIEIKHLASDLAAIASERALTNDWDDNPMYGIAVDDDQWALKYQEQLYLIDLALRNAEATQ